jgi:hypothetical protein
MIDRNIGDPEALRYLVALVLLAYANAEKLGDSRPQGATPAAPTGTARRRRDIRPPRAC